MDDIARTILGRVLSSGYSRSIAERLAKSPGGESIAATEAMVPLLAAFLYRVIGGPVVVAVSGGAHEVANDIGFFVPGEVFHLPGPGVGVNRFKPYDEVVGRRLEAARKLRAGKIAVAGVEAIVGGVPAELPGPWPLDIREGTKIDLQRTLESLVDGGYRREYTVEGWGRFAIRGGILDVFPSTAPRPVRLELVGDVVESIREFNVVTQRSLERLEGVSILPAVEPEGAGASGVPDGTTVVA